MIKENNKVLICISSPPDREKLVAEIFINNEQFAELNQESNELEFEIYPKRDGSPWGVTYNEILSLIQDAKLKLLG